MHEAGYYFLFERNPGRQLLEYYSSYQVQSAH